MSSLKIIQIKNGGEWVDFYIYKCNITSDEIPENHLHLSFNDKDFHISEDHIIPVSKGGKNLFSNFQVLCRSCNSKKGNK